MLYYFESDKSADPKGMLPLEDLICRTTSERAHAFALSDAKAKGGVLKSAKPVKGTGMQAGHHTVFNLAAASEAERQEWMRAIRECVLVSRYQAGVPAPAP